MKDHIQQIVILIQNKYHTWRESDDPREQALGPWPGWRRSYLLLALAFALMALLPWIWIPNREPSGPSSEEILRQGRVGEAVLPGSTFFLDPFNPSLSWQDIKQRKITLRPILPPRLDFRRPTREGLLASFDQKSWSSGEINRLSRAELRLGGLSPKRLDLQMQEAILQREIESEWLLREADLQGVSLPKGNFLSLAEEARLSRAGFTAEDIERRVKALLIASSLRELARARGVDVRDFEAQWVQRWSPETDCFLAIC